MRKHKKVLSKMPAMFKIIIIRQFVFSTSDFAFIRINFTNAIEHSFSEISLSNYSQVTLHELQTISTYSTQIPSNFPPSDRHFNKL